MDDSVEEWKPIVGYEGVYEVSSLGRVKRVRPWHGCQTPYLLRPFVTRVYLSVRLSDSAVRTLMVHTLVARAFHGPRPKGMHIDHINGSKHDNRSSNLRYVTSDENRRGKDEWCRGRKLTKGNVADIRQRAKHESQASLAREFGVNPSTVNNIVQMRLWR